MLNVDTTNEKLIYSNLVMEIEKFFLREFTIDNEFDKNGGEGIVSKAWHPRLGYRIFKIFQIIISAT